jgi:hypothetical protein
VVYCGPGSTLTTGPLYGTYLFWEGSEVGRRRATLRADDADYSEVGGREPPSTSTHTSGTATGFGRPEVAIRPIAIVAAGHVEVELERVVPPLLDDALGLVGVGSRLGRLARVTVTVDPDLVAVVPVQELGGGHVDRSPREVVAGERETGDGGDREPGDRALARHPLDEVRGEPVDVEGVLAEEERRRPLDQFRHARPP